MLTKISATLLALALAACSHSKSSSSDTVPAAPEFAAQPQERSITEGDMAASDAKNPIPPEDQIFFKNDSDKLNQDGLELLGEVATWVMSEDGRQVVIEGHADAVGSKDHNLDLSSRRALSAATYLRSLNVPDTRIVITAVGEAESGLEPRRSNRRVVIFATEMLAPS